MDDEFIQQNGTWSLPAPLDTVLPFIVKAQDGLHRPEETDGALPSPGRAFQLNVMEGQDLREARKARAIAKAWPRYGQLVLVPVSEVNLRYVLHLHRVQEQFLADGVFLSSHSPGFSFGLTSGAGSTH